MLRAAPKMPTTGAAKDETPVPDPAKLKRSTPKTRTRLRDDTPGSRVAQADHAKDPAQRTDSRITINPAAQATVDAMMIFSGAPFPGYDDSEPKGPPPPDEISLAEAEASD
jgi:hypothetical protein